jgi:hypothetical protein
MCNKNCDEACTIPKLRKGGWNFMHQITDFIEERIAYVFRVNKYTKQDMNTEQATAFSRFAQLTACLLIVS